ncbi:hypothetical protein [Psychroserpens sp. NJDZ02]|uniref:hypothetical protein n=1 Tax=Psychroserpens sp. NJDZ02 TaxID=2570561 RepID=UPI0010A7B053|nr:hypothetical protein [Psychroserpens sp. NJDZ02]QCE43043.1 hypothetical protein E9099_17000 [Psychroserpens sp. NJDZ02]
MKITTFLIAIFIYQFSYSQACGGGELTLEFYTKNNQQLKYEIKEVEIIDDDLLKNTNVGIKIDSTNMKGIKELKFDKNKLPGFISQSINCNNHIVDNQLKFKTLELFNKVFLLRVWSEKEEVKILIELFGGCNRKKIIVMSKEPMLIHKD